MFIGEKAQVAATKVQPEPLPTSGEVAVMSRVVPETDTHECEDCGLPIVSGDTCACRDCCEDCCGGKD